MSPNDNSFLEKNSFKTTIAALFDESLRGIDKEIIICAEKPKKWSMYDLEPDFDKSKLSKDEILAFQLKHGIKLQERGFISWNEQYKEEALNARCFIILDQVRKDLFDLKTEIIEKLDNNSRSSTIKFIRKKIKFYHQLKSSSQGKSYYNDEYRKQKNNLLKNRFDVIWWINDQFNIWPLMEREGNLGSYGSWTDYPFVDIDMQQWIDFEEAYQVIPLLTQVLEFLRRSIEAEKKIESIYNIGNVRDNINQFPYVFKDAYSCEFYLFIMNKTTNKIPYDFYYYYYYFKSESWLARKIKPRDYLNFINTNFGLKEKRIRKELSSRKYNQIILNAIKLRKNFDQEITSKNGS